VKLVADGSAINAYVCGKTLLLPTLDLSIIIVNYNVRHFLEQCLRSVFRALEGVAGEVIVVDNCSTDGSQAMLRESFGDRITLLANQDNPGFSKANNQGIRLAQGRYVLLLNPDTVVEEETFRCCIDFMDAHPEGGALGVKMIDGAGVFLPESKRALPTPWVSFYKIFGLAALFPRSKRFGRYHLTYLDRDQTHVIDILSGAFMFMRRSVLDQIGLLDETFFMYGEDIDLSYRVMLGGYQNYYLADTSIIHYKGESTKKGSLNYVRVFYQAMIIFAHKHFGGSKKQFFIAAIRLAVYFRALLAVLYRLARRFGFPLVEVSLIYLASLGITAYWEHYIKFLKYIPYPPLFRYGYLPVYALLFGGLLWALGAYRRPFRLRPLIAAPLLGFVSIATITFMVSSIENYSRAIVGLTSVFTMIIAMATRGLINSRQRGTFFFTEGRSRRVLLVGTTTESERVVQLLRQEVYYEAELVGLLTPSGSGTEPRASLPWLGTLPQLEAVVRTLDVDEVIFCNDGLATAEILRQMSRPGARQVAYKIAPPGVNFVVGPQDVLTSQQEQRPTFRLDDREHRLVKRAVDVLGSGLLLLSFPLLGWRYRKPGAALRHLVRSLFGQAHLVGYAGSGQGLPALKPGALSLRHRAAQLKDWPQPEVMDQYYAQRYTWELDVEIVLKGWRALQ
jgi:GT2 family glycosyltransferase